MSRLLQDSPAARYIERLSPTSARTTVRLLDLAAVVIAGKPTTWQEFDWTTLRQPKIVELLDTITRRYRSATVNAMLTAVRGVMKEACVAGVITPAAYFDILNVSGPAREPKKVHPPIEPDHMFKILRRFDPEAGLSAARDMALLALLYSAGMSSSAIVELNFEDLDLDQRVITSRQKGRKLRYLANVPLDQIQPWLQARGADPVPLFVAVDKSGRLGYERLNPQVVHDVLAKRSRQAGVKGVSIAAVRALAQRERERFIADGWSDHDDQGRIRCLPL